MIEIVAEVQAADDPVDNGDRPNTRRGKDQRRRRPAPTFGLGPVLPAALYPFRDSRLYRFLDSAPILLSLRLKTDSFW